MLCSSTDLVDGSHCAHHKAVIDRWRELVVQMHDTAKGQLGGVAERIDEYMDGAYETGRLVGNPTDGLVADALLHLQTLAGLGLAPTDRLTVAVLAAGLFIRADLVDRDDNVHLGAIASELRDLACR